MFKHILIPTDGSELSDRAMRDGIDLAREQKARVTLFTSSPPLRVFSAEPNVFTDEESYKEAAERTARERLDRWGAYAKKQGVAFELRHDYKDYPAEAIIEAAHGAGCDLIVMASHGRRGLASLLLGSETQRVLTHSKIPVLVCR